MSGYRFWGCVLMVPLLAAALISLGCGGGDKSGQSATGTGSKSGVAKSGDEGGTKPAAKAERTALQATGSATIKGKVTYAGDPPPPAQVQIPDTISSENKEYCRKGDTRDPRWTVDQKTKGVKNVVVWVKPPQGKYFEIPADQRKPAEKQIKIDQPFCAFEPHVAVVFPSFFDGKKQEKTGQELVIVNSARITHNTNWTPSDSSLDTGANVMLPAGMTPRQVGLLELKPNRANLEERMLLKCNIHTWMTGYVWAFDHPYAAVTNADGTYEIKNVPAGSELQIAGWHEVADYISPKGKGTSRGEKIDALKDKEVKEIDFQISSK